MPTAVSICRNQAAGQILTMILFSRPVVLSGRDEVSIQEPGRSALVMSAIGQTDWRNTNF